MDHTFLKSFVTFVNTIVLFILLLYKDYSYYSINTLNYNAFKLFHCDIKLTFTLLIFPIFVLRLAYNIARLFNPKKKIEKSVTRR